jgi:ribosomal protein L11 methyltransferase
LKIYLPESDLTIAEKIKNNLVSADGLKSSEINITKFDNHDWNKEWEKTIEPIYIKEKLIVYPSWKKDELINPQNKLLIEIDPKMSFGTGHNETTQLILGMMCDYIDSNDKYLLDYGSGTGILAIAGVKLGVTRAVAIDIDEDSIENAKEYFNINNVSGKVKLYNSDITGITETDFDVITANITRGVIIPNLKHLYSKLEPNGKLFITGILNEESEELINNLTKNTFQLKELSSKAEWSGFYCIKK